MLCRIKQVVNSLYIYLYNGIGVPNLIRGIYAREKRIGLLFLLIAVVVGGGGLLLAQKPYIKRRILHFAFPATR